MPRMRAMKDDCSSDDATAEWIQFHEAARRLANIEGERLRHPGQVVFVNSSKKLIEAGKDALLIARGFLDKTGELEWVFPADWQDCVRDDDGLYAIARHCVLREPGRRVPRYTNVEVNWTKYAKVREAEQPAAGAPTVPPQHGRPRGTTYAAMDAPLIAEMKTLFADGKAKSRSDAARQVIGKDGVKAAGIGTVDAKIRRLVDQLDPLTEKNGE
jgi:hypothetical protein